MPETSFIGNTSFIPTISHAGSLAIIGIALLLGLMVYKEVLLALKVDRMNAPRKAGKMNPTPFLLIIVLIALSKILTLLH